MRNSASGRNHIRDNAGPGLRQDSIDTLQYVLSGKKEKEEKNLAALLDLGKKALALDWSLLLGMNHNTIRQCEAYLLQSPISMLVHWLTGFTWAQ